jgi:hypothetical protein
VVPATTVTPEAAFTQAVQAPAASDTSGASQTPDAPF